MRGASKGEGLGNQFLANIREVDAIAHVVRCFEDADVTHVEGKIDPIADIETIETELMLADLDSLEKRVVALEKKAKGGDKEAKETLELINRSPRRSCARASRRGSSSARPRRSRPFEMLGLLTVEAGPLRLQCRRGLSRRGQRLFAPRCSSAPREEGAKAVVVSAKIESEIAVLPPRRAAGLSSKPSASPSPASTA